MSKTTSKEKTMEYWAIKHNNTIFTHTLTATNIEGARDIAIAKSLVGSQKLNIHKKYLDKSGKRLTEVSRDVWEEAVSGKSKSIKVKIEEIKNLGEN